MKELWNQTITLYIHDFWIIFLIFLFLYEFIRFLIEKVMNNDRSS